MISILCTFQFNNQSKESAAEEYSGHIYDFVKDHEYVFYNDKAFRLQMYDGGFGGYDHQAFYYETSSLPTYIFPPTIARPDRYRYGDRCQCGADAVKSKKHSSWCIKFRRDDDT